MARKKLGEILLDAGVLDQTRLNAALAEQRRWGGPLGRILVDMKLISEDVMVKAISQQLNFPTVDLDERPILAEVLDIITGAFAEQHGVIPFSVQGKFLDVAMSDPTDLGVIDELRIKTKLNVRTYLCGPKMMERALVQHYSRGGVNIGYDGRGRAAGDGATAGAAPAPNAPRVEAANEPTMRTAAAKRTGNTAPPPVSRLGATPASAMGGLGPDVALPPGDDGAPVIPLAGTTSAAARRAMQADLLAPSPRDSDQDQQIAALQARVEQLEALVARDEDVLRKLLALLVEKKVATREEILDRIK